MAYLYLTESNATLGLADNYVVVKHHDGMLTKMPLETLESVYIYGQPQISTQCMTECMRRGVPISFYSKGGIYFGRTQSTRHVNVAGQRMQAGLKDGLFSLEMGKKILQSKIHNQAVLLKRYARSREKDISATYEQMKYYIKKISDSKEISQMMGYEGIAARQYFSCLGELVEPAFAFKKRSRRPPLDAFNSMLSLGYSIVLNEIYGKIENAGLNPYFGIIHQDSEKHPTLASDLMEEWRVVIVDSMVMSLVNGHEIFLEHFIEEPSQAGVYLTNDGMKIFIKKMENKMRQQQKYLSFVDYSVSFRRAMDLQIRSFVQAMQEQDVSMYHPLWIR